MRYLDTDRPPADIGAASTRRWRALEAVSFVLAVAGLVYFGVVFKPSPAAKSGTDSVVNARDRFFGVAAIGADVWFAGVAGKVVHSADGGKTWAQQPTSSQANLQDIAFWNASRGVAVGNGGEVLLTSDGGKAWHRATIPVPKLANKLLRVKTFGQGLAWAVGESAGVYRTADWGQTWERVHKSEDLRWFGVAITGPSSAVVVGEFGRIARTVDDGRSWAAVESPVKASLVAVDFKDARVGTAVGLDGAIVASTDAGVTWAALPKATERHLFDVLWSGNGWLAVGNFVQLTSPDGRDWTPRAIPGERAFWITEIAPGGGGAEPSFFAAGEAPLSIQRATLRPLYAQAGG